MKKTFYRTSIATFPFLVLIFWAMIHLASCANSRSAGSKMNAERENIHANTQLIDSISFSPEQAFGKEIKIPVEEMYTISGQHSGETYREFFATKPTLGRDRMPMRELGIGGTSINGMIPFYIEAYDEFEVRVSFFNQKEEQFACSRAMLIQPGLNYKVFDVSALPDNRYMVMIINGKEQVMNRLPRR